MIARSSTFPSHRHSIVPYIDLRRSLPTLRSSLSPSASASASSDPQADAADRLAQLEEANEAARGMRRLFLATLIFWAAILLGYLSVYSE